ncbi:hypothetical protein [Chitinophaga pinensis]|uniref:T9SS C-terminal target domain-containing protein n=1 Tax=Chitinophaga pinensis (strain ATCC 43595 / DSM 2588 / LMG 13176 / NBRC 15968 / NCIMB 11800 / UQM 2034) TaxID=485918 RepID=A0A979G535_CHIPD|nr:hypothetical protein [Chitinophaga pinensis]ACU61065.1 conserved hypothetical protein [Chitinophaga pinensis DSM 2588]
MLKRVFIAAIAASAIFTSCKKEGAIDQKEGQFDRSVNAGVGADTRSWPSLTGTIPATIASGTFTLTNDRVWILDGPTYVQNGATLLIQPNTLIKGKSNSTRGTSYLIITKGGKLIADGNANTSIVFTSDKPKTQRAPGDWGGIVILGDAPTNANGSQIEGILPAEIPAGYSITYGGTNASHNGGTLKCVRIEYAGRDLGNGNEINGLTLGGVGSGTVLDSIQVSFGADDAFEFFGGTVNAKHLVAFANNDDEFDFDLGYVGNIQYAVSLRYPGVPVTADPNGIESDNNAGGTSATPITRPTLANFTILGSEVRRDSLLYGARWRRNSSFNLTNSIIAGYDEAGVIFDGAGAVTHISTAGDGVFTNSRVHGFTLGVTPTPVAAWVGWSGNVTSNIANAFSFAGLQAPFNYPAPDFRYTLAANAGKGAFGAAGSVRWDDNWASYDPANGNY